MEHHLREGGFPAFSGRDLDKHPAEFALDIVEPCRRRSPQINLEQVVQ